MRFIFLLLVEKLQGFVLQDSHHPEHVPLLFAAYAQQAYRGLHGGELDALIAQGSKAHGDAPLGVASVKHLPGIPQLGGEFVVFGLVLLPGGWQQAVEVNAQLAAVRLQLRVDYEAVGAVGVEVVADGASEFFAAVAALVHSCALVNQAVTSAPSRPSQSSTCSARVAGE